MYVEKYTKNVPDRELGWNWDGDGMICDPSLHN